MELPKVYVSRTSCYTAFLLLLISSVCLGQKGIVKQWSKEGTVIIEYHALDYPQSDETEPDESAQSFILSSKEGDMPTMPVKNQCLEGFDDGNGLALLKVHKKTSSIPAYTLEGLDFKGECDVGILSSRLYVTTSSTSEELKDEPVKEIYELLLRIKENKFCYRRRYTVTQSDLEVFVTRDDPVRLEDCGDLPPVEDVAGPITTYEEMSPSGTYYQTVFDDSKTEVIAELGTETILKCRKTQASRLRLIFVANLYHQGLVIDRFEVKSCWKEWLTASIQVDNEDPSKVKITFKKDESCYERSYEINKTKRQEGSSGTDEPLKSKGFPVYTVTKSKVNSMNYCHAMKKLSDIPDVDPEDFTRYPDEF